MVEEEEEDDRDMYCSIVEKSIFYKWGFMYSLLFPEGRDL
jgi:hypothetical protein